MAIGRAASLARPLQPPPIQRQVGRGGGRGRAQLLPPSGLAAIYCLPGSGVVLPKPITFRGGFEVTSTPMDPMLSLGMAEDTPDAPIVVRYDFPEAEVKRTRTTSPPPMPLEVGRGRGRGHPFQLPLLPQLAPLQPSVEVEDGRERPSSKSCSSERSLPRLVEPDIVEDVGPDPPEEWMTGEKWQQEERPRQISVRPTREASAVRPGCWNCGEIGHNRVDCPRPRERVCYMCGRPNITIATCPTCCQAWGQRPRAEMGQGPQ